MGKSSSKKRERVPDEDDVATKADAGAVLKKTKVDESGKSRATAIEEPVKPKKEKKDKSEKKDKKEKKEKSSKPSAKDVQLITAAAYYDDREESKGQDQDQDQEEVESPAADTTTAVDDESPKKSKKEKKDKKDKKEKKDKKKKKDKKPKSEDDEEDSAEKMDVDDDEKEQKDGEDSEEQGSGKNARFICFIGNLPFTATAEHIKKHFANVHPTSVRLLTEKGTNKSKGIAFVEFARYDHMKTCLEKYHHTDFNDGISEPRKINVELT